MYYFGEEKYILDSQSDRNLHSFTGFQNIVNEKGILYYSAGDILAIRIYK